jgi:hypothetical protein
VRRKRFSCLLPGAPGRARRAPSRSLAGAMPLPLDSAEKVSQWAAEAGQQLSTVKGAVGSDLVDVSQ